MSAELRKNRLTFIHAPILAEIVARLKAGEPALAQYLGGKQACFPRTVVGLTPSFRRSLPETGCLSQGLSHGKRYVWQCPPQNRRECRGRARSSGWRRFAVFWTIGWLRRTNQLVTRGQITLKHRGRHTDR